jgi:hypothetical protein
MKEGEKLKENRITMKNEIILDKEIIGKVRKNGEINFAFFNYGIGLSPRELRTVADLLEE